MATKKSVQKVVSKKQTSTATKVGIGVGLTAAAVTAAGAYFLYGSKDAKKNRKTVKSWALRAKSEVLEALEKAEEMSKGEYEALIDTVGGTYASLKGASKEEIAQFNKEMKAHWREIEKKAKPIKQVVDAVVSQVKKPAKKVVKKATKTAKKTAVKKVAKK